MGRENGQTEARDRERERVFLDLYISTATSGHFSTRQTETDRQTDRRKDREGEIETETDRQTETGRQIDRQTGGEKQSSWIFTSCQHIRSSQDEKKRD